jgi:hypothetical protein
VPNTLQDFIILIVQACLAILCVLYPWMDFGQDELWNENSFMSERLRCRETPNWRLTDYKGDTRVPADNGQLFLVGNHWQSE